MVTLHIKRLTAAIRFCLGFPNLEIMQNPGLGFVDTMKTLKKSVDCALSNRVPTPPGKSWIFSLKIPGPGKSWKFTLVLESPGN